MDAIAVVNHPGFTGDSNPWEGGRQKKTHPE